MLPFQERVVEEFKELNAKIKSLGEFIDGETYCKLSNIEAGLLFNQLDLMKQYADVLATRIGYFHK